MYKQWADCPEGDLQGLVIGSHNFQGGRLNILQIGLGTFSTFLQNLTDADEAYGELSWLLQASRDSSATLLGIGVEPVPKHVDRLKSRMHLLPNAALVRAAVSKESRCVEI